MRCRWWWWWGRRVAGSPPSWPSTCWRRAMPTSQVSHPDPGSEFFPSRKPDPKFLHQVLLKYFNPKKGFLNSRKYRYDPGCSSRILMFYPSRIPDPEVKKAPDPVLNDIWRLVSNSAIFFLAKLLYLKSR